MADRPLTGAVPPTAPLDDLTRARQLFSERNYLDALKLYDKVLKREPANVEALTYRGWLLFQASPTEFTDRALQSLDQAVAADARFPDAHFFRGWVLRHGKHDAAAAVAEYRTFLATNPPPEFRQRVEQELNLALCDVGQAPTGITCSSRFVEPVTVRLGGGQGFYGDGVAPVADLLEAGVDYLVCEALAELTLAILQKDRQRDESLGFTRDLPLYLQAALPFVLDGRTRFITNAGGINPIAAGRAVKATASALGVSGLKVATIVGDDVRPRASALGLPDDALFANAYLGARPIVDALDAGAQVVITGRVADAALFLAPLVHELGWRWDDWDRLAAGVVVGHLLECSGQVTGGNYSGAWWENPAPTRIAFPIAEVEDDGTAVITKPSMAGGMVTFDTVREQLLYEVHDPARYLSPDVVADFTSLTLHDLGDDRVRVTGTRGAPAPDTYKGLVCTPAGWAGEARLAYSWPDAEAKARAALRFVRPGRGERGPGRRVARGVLRCERVRRPTVEEHPGCDPPRWSAVWPGAPPTPSRRAGWRGRSACSACPGRRRSAGWARGGGGRPTQLLSVEPFLVDRTLVDAQVRVEVDEL